MKLTIILALLLLSVIVKGAFWAAAIQPVILSLGAILGALDLDVLDLQPIAQKIWNIKLRTDPNEEDDLDPIEGVDPTPEKFTEKQMKEIGAWGDE